jgi:hypothetical protein
VDARVDGQLFSEIVLGGKMIAKPGQFFLTSQKFARPRFFLAFGLKRGAFGDGFTA